MGPLFFLWLKKASRPSFSGRGVVYSLSVMVSVFSFLRQSSFCEELFPEFFLLPPELKSSSIRRRLTVSSDAGIPFSSRTAAISAAFRSFPGNFLEITEAFEIIFGSIFTPRFCRRATSFTAESSGETPCAAKKLSMRENCCRGASCSAGIRSILPSREVFIIAVNESPCFRGISLFTVILFPERLTV